MAFDLQLGFHRYLSFRFSLLSNLSSSSNLESQNAALSHPFLCFVQSGGPRADQVQPSAALDEPRPFQNAKVLGKARGRDVERLG
jgi:hypothetical protein